MFLKKYIKSFFLTILSIIFPEKCLVCDNVLNEKEKYICSHCKDNHLIKQPMKDDYFVPLILFIKDIVVLFRYRCCERAIKSFKFYGQVSIGKRLAKLLAQEIMKKEWAKELDYIVPVPLHKKALRKRGFNQCEIVASVLSKELCVPVESRNLYRIRYNIPQHNLSKEERYENISNNFALKQPSQFKGKTILLIDDVITTCSTLKACCKALKESEDITIYISALSSTRIKF